MPNRVFSWGFMAVACVPGPLPLQRRGLLPLRIHPGRLEYREEPDAVNREGNVLKKEKITISASRRLHLLNERCRALPWKIAWEESLH